MITEYKTTDTLELLHEKASKYRSGEEQFAFLMSACTMMKEEDVVPLYLWRHWFTMVFYDAIINSNIEDLSFFYEMESWREQWYNGPRAVLEFTGEAYLKINCSHIDLKDFIEYNEST